VTTAFHNHFRNCCWFRHPRRKPQKKWRSPRGLRHPCSSTITYGPRSSAKQLHRSVHPLDPVARVTRRPARIPLWPPGQYEVPTNDEPQHLPARPETRPNQRLCVPLGPPPLVAVGLSSAELLPFSMKISDRADGEASVSNLLIKKRKQLEEIFIGSSGNRVGKSCSFFDQIRGNMQLRIFSRRYSSSRNPYARRWMTRILLFKPSTKPSETLFSGLQ
jgi:hypothetical protein